MSYEAYQDTVRTLRDGITEDQAFSIIKQYGPHNDAELHEQTIKYHQLLFLYLLSGIHIAILIGILLLTGYGIELADTYLPRKISFIFDIIGTLIFILAIYYSMFGSKFQTIMLFREKNLLSEYRKISFMEGYPLYATLGLVLGFVLAFLLSKEPGVLLADYENSQKSVIHIFGTMNLVASFSSILRTYLLESKNSAIVLNWLMKWEETQSQEKLKN